MPAIPGRLSIFGVKKSSTWGVPVALGADDGVLLLSDTLTGSIKTEQLLDESAGQSWHQIAENGRESAAGDLSANLRYAGASLRMLAAVAGSDVVTTPGGATLARLHTITPQANLAGIHHTFVKQMDDSFVYEMASVKFKGLKISGAKAQKTMAAYSALGIGQPAKNSATGTNNLTTVAGITYDLEKEKLLVVPGASATLKIVPFGEDMSFGNTSCDTFEVDFQRDLEGDYVMAAPGTGISQPRITGMDNCFLTIKFPESQHLAPAFGRDYFGQLEITGAEIEAGFNYSLIIRFRRLRLEEGDGAALAGAGKNPHTVKFRCLSDATTVHTGLSAIFEGPFQIAIQNKDAAGYLA